MIVGRQRHGFRFSDALGQRLHLNDAGRSSPAALGDVCALTPLSRSKRRKRSMRTMSRYGLQREDSRLWNPSLGLRFSPDLEACSPLGGSRHLQTRSTVFSAAHAQAVQNVNVEKLSPDDGSVEQSQAACRSASSSPALQQHEQVVAPSKNAEVHDQPSPLLGFQMSTSHLQAARTADGTGSKDSFWSHTMYQRTRPCGTVEKVKVHYCTSQHTMEHVCQKYFLGKPVLGFDLEWLSYATTSAGVRANVSLIQIACPERVGLFHLAVFPEKEDMLCPTFRQIMEDPGVRKVGVQIQGDCTRLRKYLDVQTTGVFELSHLYNQVKHSEAGTVRLINKVPVALATQVHDILGLPLFKGASVRSSDWSKRLKDQQLTYAASDAYAGVHLYHALEARRKVLDPCPDRPHHAELGLPIPITKIEPTDLRSGSEKRSVKADPSERLKEGTQLPCRSVSASATQSAPQDSRISAARQQVILYKASKQSHVYARPAALRAYFLWHANPGFGPVRIASLLREPPLLSSTVGSYILDAITLENLPHDEERLKMEVLPLLHARVKGEKRYQALLERCEA